MITLLDGGLGQELIARSAGAPTPLWATRIMMDDPALVTAVHRDFFAAGAMVATTNTYAVHRDRLRAAGIEDQFENLQRQACELAVRARDSSGGGIVAGAVGPLIGSYRTDPVPVDAIDRFAEVCRLQAPFVDVFLVETVSTLAQCKAAAAGAQGFGKPIWMSVSVDDRDGTRLRSGERLTEALASTADIDALLVNCASPEAVTTSVEIIRDCGLPFGAYANGFTGIAPEFLRSGATVSALTPRCDLTPERYTDFAECWAEMGATLIGGCCEVGPAHIAEMARRLNCEGPGPAGMGARQGPNGETPDCWKKVDL